MTSKRKRGGDLRETISTSVRGNITNPSHMVEHISSSFGCDPHADLSVALDLGTHDFVSIGCEEYIPDERMDYVWFDSFVSDTPDRNTMYKMLLERLKLPVDILHTILQFLIEPLFRFSICSLINNCTYTLLEKSVFFLPFSDFGRDCKLFSQAPYNNIHWGRIDPVVPFMRFPPVVPSMYWPTHAPEGVRLRCRYVLLHEKIRESRDNSTHTLGHLAPSTCAIYKSPSHV